MSAEPMIPDEECCGAPEGSHEPFCPVWERRVQVAMANVAEAADALIQVTTPVNVSGARYQERRDYYALLRKTLETLAAVRAEMLP